MFLLVQNDPDCPAGTLGELLASSGHGFATVAAYRGDPLPSPAALTGAVVLGGEMGAHDDARFPYLGRVRAFLAEALGAGTPLLGICLGGQLLARVAGGRVSSPSPHGEQGIHSVELNREGLADPLFRGVPSPFLTFQLHQDSFTLPPGATLLAASRACPAQAFRLGKNAYGIQFHPEVDESIVSAWGRSLVPPRDFQTPFRASRERFDSSSRTLLANFISLALADSPA